MTSFAEIEAVDEELDSDVREQIDVVRILQKGLFLGGSLFGLHHGPPSGRS